MAQTSLIMSRIFVKFVDAIFRISKIKYYKSNMKIINEGLLNAEEKELINKVLNFSFSKKPICFQDYSDMLEIEISSGKKTKIGDPIFLAEIRDALEKAKKELEKANERLQKLSEQYRNTLNPEFGQAVQFAQKEKGWVSERVGSLEEIVAHAQNSYQPCRKILGEFVPMPSPKVILYLGSYVDKKNRYKELISVLIHELFHAMNFFEGKGCRSIREIDEPMVEFAAGVFLTEVSKVNPVFNIILARHESNVLDKANGVGEIACYGFGRYLMDNVSIKSAFSEEEWIEAYANISASLAQNFKQVKQIQKALYPFYPTGNEANVFGLFEDVIFGRTSCTTALSPLKKSAGALRVTRRDGSVLQMETSASTFVLAILEAGIIRVYNLKIPAFGRYLVDDIINPNSSYAATQYYEPITGLYILKHSNTPGKKKNLELISNALGLGWKVDIV